jgi:hypothetical protein
MSRLLKEKRNKHEKNRYDEQYQAGKAEKFQVLKHDNAAHQRNQQPEKRSTLQEGHKQTVYLVVSG